MTLLISWVTFLTCFTAWHYQVPGITFLTSAFALHEICTYGVRRYPEYRIRWHVGQLIFSICCVALCTLASAYTGKQNTIYLMSWYFWVLQWSYVCKALTYSAFLGFLQISTSHQLLLIMDRIATVLERHFGTSTLGLTNLSPDHLETRAPLRHGRDCRHEIEPCSICCEDIVATELHRHLPGCDHIFHAVCVDQWLLQRSATCPMCRTLVE